MNYSITVLETDPLTHLISFIVRAAVPLALQARLADPGKAGLYAAMDAADLADLRLGKIVEREATLDRTLLTVNEAAAEIVKVQAAFQAEADAGMLDRWQFFGKQYNGTAWV